ncbi:unnamed protein product [Ceratitis capitata]|uniref:(Mediterranean fruit fly) hypothetical protein n=1 Tax=Ceratitis capitata TaxID=7213 RepID=A0A811U747_CERCA|nr:unnamed protein product [Ceratitis capitata]
MTMICNLTTTSADVNHTTHRGASQKRVDEASWLFHLIMHKRCLTNERSCDNQPTGLGQYVKHNNNKTYIHLSKNHKNQHYETGKCTDGRLKEEEEKHSHTHTHTHTHFPTHTRRMGELFTVTLMRH